MCLFDGMQQLPTMFLVVLFPAPTIQCYARTFERAVILINRTNATCSATILEYIPWLSFANITDQILLPSLMQAVGIMVATYLKSF